MRWTSGLVVVVAVVGSLFNASFADVLWQNCVGIADNPQGKDGFYYNLCIQKHKFVRERHAWQFIDTNIFDTEFKACTFVNDNKHSVNFTHATFTNVKFVNSVFGSYVTEPTAMRIEKTAMRHVTFSQCRFDKSAELIFSQFEMVNVTFSECIFESNTLFTLANMLEVHFKKCDFKRGPHARVASGDKSLTFREITMRAVAFSDTNLLAPIKFEGVNGADLEFNDTKFSTFWCHSDKKENGRLTLTSAFNDTMFRRVQFDSRVHCDQTTWRRLSMFNSSFRADADFSGSNIQDVYWDRVTMGGGLHGDCTTLDFSGSRLFRQMLANMTMQCEIDLSDTDIEIVTFRNVRARRSILKGATFKQERIDKKCCTAICLDWQCHCNYSRPPTTDECPKAPYPTDLNAPQTCFPAGASVQSETGATVRMADLRHGERVAIGAGRHSDVYFFGHRMADAPARFIEITHSSGALRISPNHYLYVNDKLTTAASVREGDRLRDAEGQTLLVERVGDVWDSGLYAPASLHGDLVVDGVRVSSYTSVIHPTLAHWLLSPLRVAYRAGMHRAIEKVTLLHERGYEHVARFLRLPEGPSVVEKY